MRSSSSVRLRIFEFSHIVVRVVRARVGRHIASVIGLAPVVSEVTIVLFVASVLPVTKTLSIIFRNRRYPVLPGLIPRQEVRTTLTAFGDTRPDLARVPHNSPPLIARLRFENRQEDNQ
jgi:hypothetical protein